jgi:hypothetical protein
LEQRGILETLLLLQTPGRPECWGNMKVFALFGGGGTMFVT